MTVLRRRRRERDYRRERPGWQWGHLGIGKPLAAEEVGASLEELEPGRKTRPYHFHYGQEEMLVVLSGPWRWGEASATFVAECGKGVSGGNGTFGW
jgi:uncharacterized cupin superfamily protein